MGDGKRNSIGNLIGAGVILAAPVGGALLMNHLAPGGWGAAFGLLAGGAFGCVAVFGHKIAEMKVAGPGVDFQMRLEAVARSAEEAKLLAELSAEIAFGLGQGHSGAILGGRMKLYADVRKKIYDKLHALGLASEVKRIFAAEDQYVASVLLREVVWTTIDRALKASKATDEEKTPIYEALKELIRVVASGQSDPPADAQIRAIVKGTGADTAEVGDAIDFYRDWFVADPRVEFMLANAKTIYKRFPK